MLQRAAPRGAGRNFTSFFAVLRAPFPCIKMSLVLPEDLGIFEKSKEKKDRVIFSSLAFFRKKTHRRDKDFPYLSNPLPETPGKYGENTQKSMEFLAKKKARNSNKARKEDRGLNGQKFRSEKPTKNESNRSKVESRKIDSELPSKSHPINALKRHWNRTILNRSIFRSRP